MRLLKGRLPEGRSSESLARTTSNAFFSAARGAEDLMATEPAQAAAGSRWGDARCGMGRRNRHNDMGGAGGH